ncbi:tetratricopeptide repeat protein 39B-like isoform X2 [Brevipalpus obovatus]|uniref:tetratricopeptide repeat protein 39B-like isoform X2 n=1 Tax=Brevipalpus obovatus TaxID=246614 RepID=UPI003D9F3E6D
MVKTKKVNGNELKDQNSKNVENVAATETAKPISANGVAKIDYQNMSIHDQVMQAREASKIFFDNNFDLAFTQLKCGLNKSLYHTLSYSTMCWLRAWMTFEKPEIETAIDALKNSLEFSADRKRKMGWFDYIRRTSYDDYTEEEIHAELAYADSVFMLSLITFIQDQNFMSLIKGAYRFRCGFQSYKICSQILSERKEWETEESKAEFESGVRAGNGSYNLVLRLSPPRVLRILEFMGFSGDREFGIEELKAAADLEGTGRSIFAIMMLLMNFMYTETMIGWGDKNWSMIDYLLKHLSKCCPKSVFRPIFFGKYQQINGNCDPSIELFKEAIQVQNQWKQLHNACNWEIMWSHAFQCKWEEAAEYANRMRTESLWSPCTFTYLYAAFTYEIMMEKKDSSLQAKIDELIKEVPKLKRRFAGKSTPREKFACAKAEEFDRKNGRLVAPGFEVFYVWNIFSVITSPKLIEQILDKLEIYLQNFKETHNLDYDDWAVLHLLKGTCLRHLGRIEESVECLEKIVARSKQISLNHYVHPCCQLELGIDYMELGDEKKATEFLRKSVNDYTKYSGELIVHVRAHYCLRTLEDQQSESQDMKEQIIANE